MLSVISLKPDLSAGGAENLCHLEMSALLEEQWGWPSIRRQTKEGDSLFLLSLVPGTSISDSLNPFLGFYE